MRPEIALVGGFAGLAGAAFVIAGPLNPPAGPVGPTMKTLAEVEPRIAINAANTPGDNDATPSLYKITQPGSYYLTVNATGVAGKIGVEIAANDVTIDLGGFALQGVPGSLAGIRDTAMVSGLTVRNGTVRGWGGSGIEAVNATSCCVESVTAFSNTYGGVAVGETAVITGCTARSNGSAGIRCGAGSTMTGCAASGNGTDGIVAYEGSSFSGCAATNNGSEGFSCGGTGSFVNCSAYGNQGTGFVTGYGSIFSACSAKANTYDGFWINSGGTAVNCAAFENGRDGFLVWSGSVSNCQSSYNGRDGIRLDTASGSAVGSTCWHNGTVEPGAGVRAAASACRIDSNQVTENDQGIVAVPDCIVVRNSARANTLANYSFPLGSDFGQIITNPGNGFTATNPWANFAY